MKTKKITEGAIFLAIYAVLLLLFLYIPLIGTLAALVLPVPFLYYTAKYNWKDGLLLFAASIGITIILGSWMALATPFVFGLTGIIFGWFIHEKKDRLSAFLAATVVLLINLVAQYALSALLFNMNYIQEMLDMLDDSLKQSISIMEMMGQELPTETYQQFEQMLDTVTVLLPSLFVISAALIVLLIQTVSFPIVRRLGIHIPEAKPFRELSLPKSFIWYFFILVILTFILPIEKGTFLFNVVANITYVLQTLFILQGITFTFYFAHKKQIHKAIAIVVTVFALLNPLLHQIMRIIGIIDIGFDLRKKIIDKQHP